MNTTQQKRVPTLRFKDERGRDYPDWENKRLGELYEITSSKRVFQSEWKDSGVPFYRAREIIELSKNGYVDNDLFISPEMYKKYSEKYGAPKENDLLVTGVGTIGRLYVVPKNSKFYIKDGNIVWLKDKNLISGVFIKYLFHTRYIEKQLFDNASITTVATYTIESAKKTKVLIPATDEQQKIASFLSSVDTKFEQLGKKKALLEQYKKGITQKLFNQEIRFKDEQGNEYPEWEENCIHDICEINPTSGSLPNTFYYIDLESVHRGILVKQTKVKKINAPSRAQRLLRKQDVLFQTVRPYQQNNYYFELNGDYVASTGYAQLRAKASSRFLFYLLHVQNVVNTIIARCTGTSYPAINSNDLGTIKVLVPTENEQQKIAAFLSSIDKKIELVTEQLKQARTFKKGLLQQMFI